MAFLKTERQVQALEVLNKHRHGMLFGGSRSGKTAIIVRNIFLRAMKSEKPSKHLMTRFRYNHARVSLGHETVPKILSLCFPGVVIPENKSDGYWTVPCVNGGESQVWLGGTDDADRVEKILGNEYSTIYFNEASQIPWDAVLMLQTRLAENTGLAQRAYYDCNPPGKKHWTYQLFEEGRFPDETKHDWDIQSIRMNPGHNRANLSPEYIRALESLPKRQRQRFLEGLYLLDVEGALWTDQMIVRARLREPAELKKTVIAVDPSVSHTATSDECGIIVCSLDTERRGVVHDDLSGKYTTRKWANKAVAAFYAFEANEIVAEVNQGGDLVKDAIHNVDPHVPVVTVHASKSKFARAEPISMLYEPGQEKVSHLKDLPKLESELTETVFSDRQVKESPNRLDALVWGLTHLMIGKVTSRFHIG